MIVLGCDIKVVAFFKIYLESHGLWKSALIVNVVTIIENSLYLFTMY
jgi:hypothetical protein